VNTKYASPFLEALGPLVNVPELWGKRAASVQDRGVALSLEKRLGLPSTATLASVSDDGGALVGGQTGPGTVWNMRGLIRIVM